MSNLQFSLKKAINNILHSKWFILKAVVFGISWLIFPWWISFLIATYFYFFPIFHPDKLLVPFLAFLFLTLIQKPDILFAVVFSIIFYYILLIKDLLVINRKFAMETLVLSISFFLIRDFFMNYGIEKWNLILSFFFSVIIGLLVQNLISFFKENVFERKDNLSKIIPWIIFFLSWELILAGIFIPINFIYQSIIVFIGFTFFYELIMGYFWNELSRERIFIISGIFFSLMVLFLVSAPWFF